MKMEKNYLKYGFIIWFVVIYANCCGGVGDNPSKSKIDSTINVILKAHKVQPFTIKLLIAQARYETGDYTSKLFREHNNLYGMMHPKKRITRSLGPKARAEKKSGYASYASIEDSVEDMLLYLWERHQTPYYRTSYEYVRFLKKNHFFTDSEARYLMGLRRCMKELKQQ